MLAFSLQMGLRETGGALAARAHGRDDPPLRHLNARRPELRIARQRRRCSTLRVTFLTFSRTSSLFFQDLLAILSAADT